MGVAVSQPNSPRSARSISSTSSEDDPKSRIIYPYYSMYRLHKVSYIPSLGRPDNPVNPLIFIGVVKHCPLPRDILRRFPAVDHATGRLLKSFHCRPPGTCYARYMRKVPPDRLFYRADVVFMPQDEARIFVAAGMYAYRPGMSLQRINALFDGLLIQWTLNKEDQKCQIIKGCRSPDTTGVSISSCGRFLAWPNTTGFILFDRYSAAFSGTGSFDNGEVVKSIAFSPSGNNLASISSYQRMFKLRLIAGYQGARPLRSIFQINLTLIDPTFAISGTFKEQASLRWSSDESMIAVGGSEGNLLIISRYRGGPPPIVLTPSFLTIARNEARLAGVRAFDFSPTRHFGETQIIAFATLTGSIHLYDPHRNRLSNSANIFPPSQTPDVFIRVLKFSNNGLTIAIGDSLGRVSLLNSDTIEVVMELEYSSLRQPSNAGAEYCGISSLAFSYTDRYLAAGCSDGMIKFWCLEARIENLMKMCRRVIREQCSLNYIRKLPLPDAIIAYLQDTIE